jgi:hypothetical protein
MNNCQYLHPVFIFTYWILAWCVFWVLLSVFFKTNNTFMVNTNPLFLLISSFVFNIFLLIDLIRKINIIENPRIIAVNALIIILLKIIPLWYFRNTKLLFPNNILFAFFFFSLYYLFLRFNNKTIIETYNQLHCLMMKGKSPLIKRILTLV